MIWDMIWYAWYTKIIKKLTMTAKCLIRFYLFWYMCSIRKNLVYDLSYSFFRYTPGVFNTRCYEEWLFLTGIQLVYGMMVYTYSPYLTWKFASAGPVPLVSWCAMIATLCTWWSWSKKDCKMCLIWCIKISKSWWLFFSCLAQIYLWNIWSQQHFWNPHEIHLKIFFIVLNMLSSKSNDPCQRVDCYQYIELVYVPIFYRIPQ